LVIWDEEPMRQFATEDNLAQSLSAVKDFAWEGDYREAGRNALKEVLEPRMSNWVDEYLDDIRSRDEAGPDRRNGHFDRHLLTELGDLVLSVPLTRRTSAAHFLRKFKRRPAQVDRLILDCFVLGCSTRKVAEALVPVLGERLSAATVSRVAKQLDAQVAAFHRRQLSDRYRVLIFDGVVMKQKTGAGAVKRVALVVRGILFDGRKENIDF